MGGQLRVALDGAIIGWDLGTGLAFAAALGINPVVAAELLPVIEAAAVRGLNQNVLTALEKDNG
jgi:hypothetical protein